MAAPPQRCSSGARFHGRGLERVEVCWGRARAHVARCAPVQYTMFNDLNGDSSAKSADDCKNNCCSDSHCQVWQWSDNPLTPPNCWTGDSMDYGDSGGVEWQGEQGKFDPPPPPPPGFWPCEKRPTVGTNVTVHSSDPASTCSAPFLNRVGTIWRDDRDSRPYKIRFDGSIPSCYFRESELWCAGAPPG